MSLGASLVRWIWGGEDPERLAREPAYAHAFYVPEQGWYGGFPPALARQIVEEHNATLGESLLFKLTALQAVGLHALLFRNAGVGCQFYEGPRDAEGFPTGPDWQQHLVVHGFHPGVLAAVDAECVRLKPHIAEAP